MSQSVGTRINRQSSAASCYLLLRAENAHTNHPGCNFNIALHQDQRKSISSPSGQGLSRLTSKVDKNELETLSVKSVTDAISGQMNFLSSKVDTNSSNIAMLGSQTDANRVNISLLSADISSLSYNLSAVSALAENANRYAHSHDWSDERLKQNIVPLEGALSSLFQIQGISFYWQENRPVRSTSRAPAKLVLSPKTLRRYIPSWYQQTAQGIKVSFTQNFPQFLWKRLRNSSRK